LIKPISRRTVLASLAAAPSIASGTAKAATTPAKAGLFTGTAMSMTPQPIDARVANFDRWLYNSTKKTPMFIDFAAHSSWTACATGLGLVHYWKNICPTGQLVLAWPLATDTRPWYTGFRDVTSGRQNALLTKLCQVLAQRNMGNAIIRLGWEMNGNWYPWSANADLAGYLAAYRYVVNYCRAQPGMKLRWCWNPNVGLNALRWEDCYPGYDYVDYIGVDVYDMWWGDPAKVTQANRWKTVLEMPYGLKQIATYAKTKGKPLCIPEWGVGKVGPIGGGRENPAWVDYMADFIEDPTNHVAWHAYWNRDLGSGYEGQIYPTTLRPLTAARYKARFGA
jgi:hypothetical protein